MMMKQLPCKKEKHLLTASSVKVWFERAVCTNAHDVVVRVYFFLDIDERFEMKLDFADHSSRRSVFWKRRFE